jgi:cobalt-zinc-cadmium efflux system membrane fusion protein
VIKEVYANVGDVVKKDQTLVKIESNGTLEHYTVTAPQDGTIITRNTNIGDLSQEKLLFTISDLSKLWAKYHVFPNDIAKIKKGDPVEVLSLDNKYHTNSTISFISPIVDPLTQSVFAVAEVPTSSEPWRAGTIIKGNILVSKQQVPLAVKVSALQKRKEATVVFIQNGDEFQAKEVKLGKSDQEWVEVLSGITPGTNYVVKNSFIIKSELEKAGASHEH